MAIRKRKTDGESDKKKTTAKGGGFRAKLRFFRNMICLIAAFLLGGIVFNLDRSGEVGVWLLRCKNFIPYPLSKLLPGAGATPGDAVPEQVIQGKVIDVADGDTATVLVESGNQKYKIRFFGIDAPERSMTFGREARKALSEKILAKDVTVKVIGVDLYKRAVGKVMIGARYINLEMVAEGNAWYYSDYAAREYDLAAAEKEARAFKRGLWQENNPTPPWQYRKASK